MRFISTFEFQIDGLGCLSFIGEKITLSSSVYKPPLKHSDEILYSTMHMASIKVSEEISWIFDKQWLVEITIS